MHAVRTQYMGDQNDPQCLFVDLTAHAVPEDARGYRALAASVIRSMLTSAWSPDIAGLATSQAKRRAGYLIEFAVGKMLHDREKKQRLLALAEDLRTATRGTPETVLFPNPEGYDYSMERNTDPLAKDWGLLDNVARSDILKMIAE